MFAFFEGVVNEFYTDIFISMMPALTCHMHNIHFIFQACITAPMGGRKAAGALSLEFNTWSLCHFLSASHDIGNYSALACTQPGRLGVLLPCSGVSHSNRSKLAVTKAGLGSRCYASETMPFFFLSPGSLLTAKSMQGNKSL